MEENNRPLHSSHIFMFPFRFDLNRDGFDYEFEFYKDKNIRERVPFAEKLMESVKSNGWDHEPFELDEDLKGTKEYMYNEFAYFYDYVRDGLYNLDSEDPISYYFEKKELKGGIYEIKIKKTKDRKEEIYALTIDGISLRLFKTGIGILSIELDNYSYPEFNDVLNINDYGRRVYPQYIKDCSSDAAKDSFLADSIHITGMEEAEHFRFDISKDIHLGSHIMYLLGDAFSQEKKEKNRLYIQPSLDDRMFTVSWYGNDNKSRKLQEEKTHYLHSDDWHKYIYLDTSMSTVQNDKMKKELLEKSTYSRWSNFGTIFGITRYAFSVLTNSETTLKNNKAEFIIRHTKSMYFQMMHMLLANRSSILRFSDEVAALASEKELDTEKLSMTYRRYLTFYNRMYFKEVTHQEQGIELYDMALEQMKIPDHIEKLDGKFTKLHDFANLQSEKVIAKQQQKVSDKMNTIAKVGAALLLPPLLIGFFGMDGIKEHELVKDFGTLAVLLSIPLGFYLAGYVTKEENNE